jgi:hypothetical protein
MEITPGAKVLARSASDELLPCRATSGVVPGHSFPVVWVCTEEDWEAAQSQGIEPDSVPWPAEDVRLAEKSESVTS